MNSFQRSLLFIFLALILPLWQCKNPAAPREPGKFASQATFLRVLDSIVVNGQALYLPRGQIQKSVSTPSGQIYFVGNIQVQGSNNALIVKTNALGRILWSNIYEPTEFIYLSSIVSGDNGKFYVSGEKLVGSAYNGYLLGIDSSGTQLWSKTFTKEGNYTSKINGVVKQANGNPIFFGDLIQVTPSGTNIDGLVLCTDPNGNMIFEKEFKSLGRKFGRRGDDIRFYDGFSSRNGSVLAGSYVPVYVNKKGVLSPISLAPDIYLIKLSEDGDSLGGFLYDDRTVGGDVYEIQAFLNIKRNTNDKASKITVLNDESIVILGETNGSVYLLRVNADFSLLFWKLPQENYDIRAVSKTSDGNFVIVGGSTQSIDINGIKRPAAGQQDVYIAKYNLAGELIWEITQGTPRYDLGFSIEESVDKGFIISGISDSKPLILKVDERGLLDPNN